MKKKISLQFKTSMGIGFLVFFFVSVIAVAVFFIEKNTLKKKAIENLHNVIEKASATIELQIADRQKTVDAAMNLAHTFFYTYGKLKEHEELVDFEATQQLTKIKHNVKLKKWTLGDLPLHRNYVLVDSVKKLSVETATIFQRIDSGFIRISTNVMKLDNTRAVGTFIPHSSPVSKAIEKGQTYRGRAYVVKDWYLTGYEPIYLNGKIEGILYVGSLEKDFSDIENIFLKMKIFNTTFIY